MADTVHASAPGKVVLSGEYAVLDGAPAIGMAVNRRAHVEISPIDGDTFRVSAPGYCERPASFRLVDGRVVWEAGSEPLPVIDAAVRAGLIDRDTVYSINMDTTAFSDPVGGPKIGIGSSAALVVALCAALRNEQDISGTAMNLHRDLQGGSGSGVDIACSLSGGLIEFRMSEFSVARLQWPPGLHYRLIWTGRAASTRQQLAKLERRESKASRQALADASVAMAENWRSGTATAVVEGYSDYTERLHEFSVDHDLGIFDAGHHDLWQAARASGLTYKPCGAGGGDIGILLSTEETSLDTFVNDLPENCSILQANRSEKGLES